jgi:hypothetical protein
LSPFAERNLWNVGRGCRSLCLDARELDHLGPLFSVCGDELVKIGRQARNKLTYDTSLGGYRTDLTEEQVRGAPAFSRDRNWDWSDRTREQQLHDYYRAPYYWDE